MSLAIGCYNFRSHVNKSHSAKPAPGFKAIPAVNRRHSLTNELRTIQQQPRQEADRIVRQWSDRLQKLEALSVSPEYAGALAELEMTPLLQRNLPDTYTVFNDIISIEMDEWFFADGENRRAVPHRSIMRSLAQVACL